MPFGPVGWEYTGLNTCVLPPTVQVRAALHQINYFHFRDLKLSSQNKINTPGCRQVRPNDTCTSFGILGSVGVVDLAGPQGEYESRQLFLRNDIDWQYEMHVTFSDLAGPGGSISAEKWHYWQVGYVFCNQSGRYAGSGGGWRSDPLLPVSEQGTCASVPSHPCHTGAGFTIPVSTAQSVWMTLQIPADAAAGTYVGAATLWSGNTSLLQVRRMQS